MSVDLYNMGTIALNRGDLTKAESILREAVAHEPNNVLSRNNLGLALYLQGKLSEAITTFHEGIRASGDSNSSLYNNLGNAIKDKGFADSAIAMYENGLRIDPDCRTLTSNKIMTANYVYRSRELAFGECRNSVMRAYRRLIPVAIPRRLYRHSYVRIGYVSPDFRRHSVANFILPILENHNRNSFAVYCYSNSRVNDSITSLVRNSCDSFVDINGVGTEDAVRKILHDEIDILVDLAGHTGDNRLDIFARKPAPIQVLYCGYPSTTGLDTIDYVLLDKLSEPDDGDAFYTEKIVRLPNGFLCYSPISDIGSFGPKLFENPNGVVFGSFNSLAKLSWPTIEAWSEILKQTPGSMLLLKTKALNDRTTNEMVRSKIKRAGIAPDRLLLVGHTPNHHDHFRWYESVDVALDPWPYNGTTTTCDALWMGVPVVSLVGDRQVSRMGGSILRQAGLRALACYDEEEYIKTAVKLGSNQALLDRIANGIAQRFRNSPVCDHKLITKDIENAYLSMLENNGNG